MATQWFKDPRAITRSSLLLVLLLLLACGSAAQAPPATAPETAASPPQSQPTATLLPPVGMRPPTPAPELAAGAPTPMPEPAVRSELPTHLFGGHIPMSTTGNPQKRPLWHISSGEMLPMFNTLVEWDPEHPDPTMIRGDLAESWAVLDGGQTYLFNLHEKARWHDGVPVTAADVAFSLDAMVCPDCFEIMKGQFRLGNILFAGAYEAGNSRAIDDKTVEVKLKYPVPAFLDMLSLSIIAMGPRHTVLDEGKVQDFYKPESLNGSGPFKLRGFSKDVKSEFVKNENYWKEGLPRIDAMTYFVITDPGTLAAAFKSKQVLMQRGPSTPFNPVQALKLGEDMTGELTVHWAGPSGFVGIYTNVRKKPFDDVRVRRALMLALHRQPIIDIMTNGRDLLGTPLPPDSWYTFTSEEAAQMPGFRELDGQKHPDDLAEARRLLAEAGYGDDLKVEILARDASGYPDQAAIVADQLRKNLNWDVKIRVMESAAGFAAYDNGDFQLGYQGGTYNLDDPDAAFMRYDKYGQQSRRCGGGLAGESYVPAGVQDFIEAQAREPDRMKRKELTLKAHEILLNQDNCYVGIMWTMRHWPVNDRIQNFHMHPSNYSQGKHEAIWCNPRC